MSPASKSKTKSKDKATVRSAKEQPKTSIKSSGSTNTVSGTPGSAYNPTSGTFHALEIQSATSSPPSHDNGRFKNIDDTDGHSCSPHGTVSEYDSVSNNGSCSGESEDPKEKLVNSTRLETAPSLDNERQEKIRLKNEKKHQRQRERRAQELHERCCGYLMSRKLEGLSQQLVAMGFSEERATLALMLNEGKLEESVNWLFEGSEEEAHNRDTKLRGGGNLKIDISEELAQVLALETKYKCSKQEVERAVVACEGDLTKAEGTLLRAQKPAPLATQQIPEEVGDPKNLRPQEKADATPVVTVLHRMDGRVFNYTKTPIAVPTNLELGVGVGGRNLQPMNQPKTILADKRWTSTGTNPFPSSLAPSMQVTLSSVKSEVRLGLPGNEGRVAQQIVREPIVMMQRPQPINVKQNPVSNMGIAPPGSTVRYSSSVPVGENIRPNGNLLPNHSTGNFGLVNQNPEQFYRPSSQKESQYPFRASVDSISTRMGGSMSIMGKSPQHPVSSQLHSSYNSAGASWPNVASPSSLGLFTGWSPAGTTTSSPSSHVDWSTKGSPAEFDYTSIDWSVDPYHSSPKQSGLYLGLSSFTRNTSGQRHTDGSFIPGLPNNNGVASETSSSAGLREWTSPFAGQDIFSVSRQFVSSPSP